MLSPGVTFETVDLNRPRVAALRTDICGFAAWPSAARSTEPSSCAAGGSSSTPSARPSTTPSPVRRCGCSSRTAGTRPSWRASPRRRRRGWRCRAGSSCRAAYSAIGRGSAEGTGPLVAPSRVVSDSPGAWGNRLSAIVFSGGRGATDSLPNQPADGATIRVASLAGFEAGSWVRLIQDGDVASAYAFVAALDQALLEITWETPVAGLDFARPIRLETVEFTLSLASTGRRLPAMPTSRSTRAAPATPRAP